MSKVRRRIRSEAGFTLVELLATMPIALIVLAIVVQAIGAAERSERTTRQRSEALRAQQAGLERLTRELREAKSFQYLTSQSVQFEGYVRPAGAWRSIKYDCSAGSKCVRLEGPTGGTPTGPVPVIEGLENADVFMPEPNFVSPRFVEVVARVRFSPDHRPITLRDGVQLRNLSSRF